MKLTEKDKDFICDVSDSSGIPVASITAVINAIVSTMLLNYVKSDKKEELGVVPYLGSLSTNDQLPDAAILLLNPEFKSMIEDLKQNNILQLSDFVEGTQIEPAVVRIEQQ